MKKIYHFLKKLIILNLKKFLEFKNYIFFLAKKFWDINYHKPKNNQKSGKFKKRKKKIDLGLIRPNYLLDYSTVLKICDVGKEGIEIIEDTAFTSQNYFNESRGLKVASFINDHFEKNDFTGKRILELGPGHYSFAMIARYLGAIVTCVEKDKSFIKLGRKIGFDVHDIDFNDLDLKNFESPFDGLWIKGTFNACNYKSEDSILKFSETITSLVKPDGWAFLTTVNKSADKNQSFVEQRISIQKNILKKLNWECTPIKSSHRKSYALNYSGSYYYFTKNISRIKVYSKSNNE